MAEVPKEQVFLSDAQLAARYDVSRPTIWRWHRDINGFPRVVKLSSGCARWKLSEIEAWEITKSTKEVDAIGGA